jgi:hypothetical protein
VTLSEQIVSLLSNIIVVGVAVSWTILGIVWLLGYLASLLWEKLRRKRTDCQSLQSERRPARRSPTAGSQMEEIGGEGEAGRRPNSGHHQRET